MIFCCNVQVGMYIYTIPMPDVKHWMVLNTAYNRGYVNILII